MIPIANELPGAGIHSIEHLALELPDLADAQKFITAFGLRVEQGDDELQLRAAAAEHIWLRVFAGSRKRLAYMSVGCYENDLPAIEKQVLEAGGVAAQAHPRGTAEGFWFNDPDGNLVQVTVAAKTMPDAKAVVTTTSVPAGVMGAIPRSQAQPVHPARLAHVLLFTPSVDRAVEFYRRGLGLLVADRSRDIVAFMSGRHGCDHHLVAFGKSEAKGVHHTSWAVPRIEDVGLGSAQMISAGYGHHWGVGRHVLGSNYFVYVQDPWGGWWEYSCDIDYIPAGASWPSGDYEPENAFYLWGPEPPDDFLVNVES